MNDIYKLIHTKLLPLAACICILFSCTNSKETEKQANEESQKEGQHADEITLSQEQIHNSKLAFSKVELKNLSASIQVNGVLDVPPQHMVSVSAMMGGFIKYTKLLQGMKVNKGEVVATIQNPDFIELQQNYATNFSKLAYLEEENKRQKELLSENVASAKTYQLASAEYNSIKAICNGMAEKLQLLGISPKNVQQGNFTSTVSIHSPIDGYVTEVHVNLGKFVNPQDVICKIINTKHLHAELTVFEKDITKLRKGQKIRFQLVNEGLKERTASVYLINKEIAPDRSIRVHAHLDKEDPSLLPNMYLKASIETGEQEVTALPDDAFMAFADTYYLFYKVEKGNEAQPDASKKPGTEQATGNNQEFKVVEVGKGVSQNGYTEALFPQNFQYQNLQFVSKGAYNLLTKMNNSEEE